MTNKNDLNSSVRDGMNDYITEKAVICEQNCKIDYHLYDEYGVKKGLRDKNGTGVLAGLTNISHVQAYQTDEEGNKVPCDGKLLYRGYDVTELVRGFVQEKRFGFEETTYLLLFGELPTAEELQQFTLCDSGERIPSFAELLAMVRGRVPLIVEIKSESVKVASSCEKIDALLRAYQGAYCIESFNPLVLWWFRFHHGSVVRGQLSSNFRKDGGYTHVMYFFMTHLLLNFLTKPDFIAYNHKFYKEPGRRICKKLYRCPAAAWTIQSQKDLEAMRGDFDVFIFDSFRPVNEK